MLSTPRSRIWLVLQLNHPLASGIHIGPGSFQAALVRMDQIQSRH